MDNTKVRYITSAGHESFETIQIAPIKCPHCKIAIIPKYLYAHNEENDNVSVFCQCTNPDCKKTFLANYVHGNMICVFSSIQVNASMDKKVFSDIINCISPSFCEIYNQAYAAQQMNLSQICGVGYRKALEFLIKDYIISSIDNDTKEGIKQKGIKQKEIKQKEIKQKEIKQKEIKQKEIKQKNLSKCIQEDISSQNIKTVAARATWLGNDETHYVRKWEDKDINDLIGMVDLTIRWIESEVETKRLLEEMPLP